MKALILLAALSALVLAEKPRTNVPQKSLFVYCAAGMRKPMETLARDYETSNKTKLELTYDGTNKLLGQIKLTRKGDVYIAGDADYIAMARKDNLVGEAKTLCYFIPVIMVKKGNPLKIISFFWQSIKTVMFGGCLSKVFNSIFSFALPCGLYFCQMC